MQTAIFQRTRKHGGLFNRGGSPRVAQLARTTSQVTRAAVHVVLCVILLTPIAPNTRAADTALDTADQLVTAVTAARNEFQTTLATYSDQASSPEERQAINRLRLHRDPSRLYFFVPTEKLGLGADDAPAIPASIADSCRTHGETLAELAERAAASGSWSLAYQLAHESLLYAPQTTSMRQALGLPGRPVAQRTPYRSRVGTRPETRLQWPARSYRLVTTPHFVITTNDEEATALKLAETLERLYAVWDQMFFDCWNLQPPRTTSPLRFPRLAAGKRRQVVLLRSQADYVATLRRIEPRAELTRGYYHPASKTAFFVGGDTPQISTWYHEATHQLFAELPASSAQAGKRQNVWIIEGIAVYMESLQSIGAALTVGGLEASRLQFARFRALRERQHVPLDQLIQLSQTSLQGHEDIQALYSQSAGMTHFLVHAQAGRWRGSLLNYLSEVYRDYATADTLSQLTGTSFAELEQAYLEFLQVNDAQLMALDPAAAITELALGNTQVTNNGLSQLRQWQDIRWLDLFGTQVTDDGLQQLDQATALTQLSLERTRIGDATVARIRAPELAYLDLSNTAITDQAMQTVAGLDKLESLWVSGTSISDTGAEQLRTLVRLRTLDLTGTQVTAAARERLEQALPNLSRPE
ncbi:MAG: DUF1570 domain-containing protein [Planctomycetales bacterium]|nr:DUF1570 domain-containing protein [Planctomycetales bacterium]